MTHKELNTTLCELSFKTLKTFNLTFQTKINNTKKETIITLKLYKNKK